MILIDLLFLRLDWLLTVLVSGLLLPHSLLMGLIVVFVARFHDMPDMLDLVLCLSIC